MKVRPTRSTWAALALAVVLQVLTRATADAWLAFASAAVLAVVGSSFFLRPRLDALDVQVGGPDRVVVGADLTQVLRVRNRGSSGTPACSWSPHAEGLSELSVVIPGLLPGEDVSIPFTRTAIARGEYDACSALLASSAPFGVLRTTMPVPLPTVFVHPQVTEPSRRTDRVGAPGVGTPSGVAGPGLEILGLRPWRAGDASRAISARATARTGRRVVLEREQERLAGRALTVVAQGGRGGPLWDAQISDVVGRVLQAVEAGDRVTLVAGPGVAPTPRVLDRTAVLDFFARVDKAGLLSVEELGQVARPLHPGGLMIALGGASADTFLGITSPCCPREVLRG